MTDTESDPEFDKFLQEPSSTEIKGGGEVGGEDPLNFSTGSGYYIISEIEHQLGLRGNKSTITPGQDTINEEEEKRKFFAGRLGKRTHLKNTDCICPMLYLGCFLYCICIPYTFMRVPQLQNVKRTLEIKIVLTHFGPLCTSLD
uniref:Uncharacterized protein n=1 Tax=Amphimedon queenslandica TaxID=400682 RepID=A0A1X7UGM0_AMPQE